MEIKEALENTSLSMYERYLLAHLIKDAKDGFIDVSNRDLEKSTGMSRSQANRTLMSLRQKGVIWYDSDSHIEVSYGERIKNLHNNIAKLEKGE